MDKLLVQLAYPLSLALCLVVAAFIALLLRRRVWVAGFLLMGAGWLGFWSLPVTADAVLGSLEVAFAGQSMAALPVADVAVVLGGALRPARGTDPEPDLGEAADRIWHAARLFHAGKAQWIVASGGCALCGEASYPEAGPMRELLVDLGVPRARVLLEEESRNTRENAVYSAELLRARGFRKILLVTSAFHMRRALATFRAAGVDATPAPTDFRRSASELGVLAWLPDAGALHRSTVAIKEYLGYWVYRWRGWVTEELVRVAAAAWLAMQPGSRA